MGQRISGSSLDSYSVSGPVLDSERALPSGGSSGGGGVQVSKGYTDRGLRSFGCHLEHQPQPQWVQCCEANADGTAVVVETTLESSGYVPVHFDNGTTIDLDRSYKRYPPSVVHSHRARTQRRAEVWSDWLRNAIKGRPITLLQGFQSTRAEGSCRHDEVQDFSCRKVPAVYYIDSNYTKLSILPQATGRTETAVGLLQDLPADQLVLTLVVKKIQVIRPASDCAVFFEEIDSELDDSERARAVLLQYVAEDSQRRRICFLEESKAAMDRFVESLTAVWLEKGNEHSMWF